MKPFVEKLSEKYENVHFLDCDVDILDDLEEVSNISGVPTFLFMKSGKKLEEFSGANESKLVETVERLK